MSCKPEPGPLSNPAATAPTKQAHLQQTPDSSYAPPQRASSTVSSQTSTQNHPPAVAARTECG